MILEGRTLYKDTSLVAHVHAGREGTPGTCIQYRIVCNYVTYKENGQEVREGEQVAQTS